MCAPPSAEKTRQIWFGRIPDNQPEPSSHTWSQIADGGAQAPRMPCKIVRVPASSWMCV